MKTEQQINLPELASKIAGALGPRWVAVSATQDWNAYITHTDDPDFAIYVGTSADEKTLYINGTPPLSNKGISGLRYNERVISINVSATKTPEQIAKDITRRLLPGYTEQYQRAKASIDEAEAYEAKRVATHEAAEAMIRTYNQAPQNAHHAIYLKSSSATEVTIDLSGVTLTQLAHIIALLSEGHGGVAGRPSMGQSANAIKHVTRPLTNI